MDMNLLRRFKYWCIRNYYLRFRKDKIVSIRFGSDTLFELGDVYVTMNRRFIYIGGKNKFLIDYIL